MTSPFVSTNNPTPGSSGFVPVVRRNSLGVGDAICGCKGTEGGFGVGAGGAARFDAGAGIDDGRLTGELGGAGDFCLAGEVDPVGDVGEPAREEPPAGGERRVWLCCEPGLDVDGAGGARELPRRFGVDPLELDARDTLPPALADLLCPDPGGAKLSFAVPAELLRLSRPCASDEFRGGCPDAGRGGGAAGDTERAALADGGRITSSTNAGANGFGSSPEDVVNENNGICCKFSNSNNL